jgi:DNA-binding NarL/FixJ family response regulator
LRDALSAADDLAVVSDAEPGQPQPDAILVCACAPIRDGADLVRSLRQRFPAARVILVSDCAPAEGLITAVRVGADGHVEGQQPTEAVIASVRRILNAEATVPAAVAFDALRKLSVAGPNGASPALRQLTMRQSEILRLVAEGMTNKEIAHRLGLSEQTIANHVKAILQRLDVHRRLDAAWLLHDGVQEPA